MMFLLGANVCQPNVSSFTAVKQIFASTYFGMFSISIIYVAGNSNEAFICLRI